ncbi:putative reverse transcriptase domain-containing protein [Tanacetum coccineum]
MTSLIYLKSKEDHEVHLKSVLELLKKEKLFAKFSKCEFWLKEVHFLKHVVNNNGIHVDPNKIEVVKNWKAPKTSSEIRLFMGLAGYYRRFIANFFKIAKPLTLLTQKNRKYEWDMEQEEAFHTLKDNLYNTPILLLLDGSKNFVIHEKNYTTQDLELGVVVFALKTWRHYLYRTKSVIFTDHKSLQHIFDHKELNMRQRQWIKLFSDYDYEIRYHPGKANVVVDALSWKEKAKPRRVRAMSMTIQPSIKNKLLAAQNEVTREGNAPAGMLHGLDQQMEKKEDGGLYFVDRIWVPLIDPDGRFTLRFWQMLQKALGMSLNMCTTYHPQTDKQSERTIQTLEDMLRACEINFGGNWDTRLPLVEFSYNNSYHSSIRCAPIKALYGRKCRSAVL